MLALFWALVWSVVGAALGFYRVLRIDSNLLIPFRFGLAVRIVCGAALVCATIGAINGFAFATLLGIFGRRLRGGLTRMVVGGLGAISGAILPLAYEVRFWRDPFDPPALPAILIIAAILGALGACTALGTLAIARAGGGVSDAAPAESIR
jgi:hypothetical protein